MQVHIMEGKDAADMARYLLPMVDARNGRERLRIRRLDANLELHAAARQLAQGLEDLFVEVVDGDFKMEIRVH